MSIIYLDGSVEDEMFFDFRRIFPEECGLFFGFNIPDAAFNCIRALRALEPRGERGSGIFSYDGKEFYRRTRVGKVSVQFSGFDLGRCSREFPGRIVVGHNRYATAGKADAPENVQPFLRHTKWGEIVVAHNGTFVNAASLRKELLAAGQVLSTTSDTEMFFNLLALSGEDDLEKAVISVLNKIKAAYSLVVVSRDKCFVARDRYGIRPLSLGKLNRGYVACSETFAIDQIPGAKYWRYVNPGEMLVFEKNQVPRSVQYAKPQPRFCIFEAVYFMRPRSRINGCYVEDFRYSLGLAMAKDILPQARQMGIDMVVPVLDSGEYFARGLAYGLGLPYIEALARTKNFGESGVQDRSFTAASNEERIRTILGKHNLRFDLVAGKRPLIADDSIVRANTSRIIVDRFKQAGAAGVYFASGYPPIKYPCFNGMDFQTKGELIASTKDIPVIKKRINVEWLFYLSEKTLVEVAKDKLHYGICGACYNGNYPQSRSIAAK